MPPRTPLLRPSAFFASDPDGRVALAIWGGYLFASTLFLLASLWVLLSRTAGLINIPVSEVGSVVGRAVVSILLVAVVGLVVRIVAMHYVAGRDAQKGSLEAALVVSCWSYAPLGLELGVFALLRWSQAQTQEFSVLYPADFAANLESVFAEIGWAEQVVAVVALVWSLYILAEGFAATHGLERRQTVPVAVLIGVAHLLV
jgi:hypothetical protein